jgi:apolipoprotein N-acyltransferase
MPRRCNPLPKAEARTEPSQADTWEPRGWRWRALAPVVATSVSAILFGLSFPAVDWSVLAWIALVPFFAALHGRGLRARLGLGWLWGVSAAYGLGLWFVPSVSGFFLQPVPVAVVLFLAVASFMVAPYVMLFAGVFPLLSRRGAWAPLLLAAAWVASEWLRGRLLTGTPFFVGNPWGLIGYSQATHLELMQVASLAGIYGVSFAVVAVNATLLELWNATRSGDGKRRVGALMASALTFAIVAAIWVYGWAALREGDRWTRVTPAIEVALAQGVVEGSSVWRSDLYGKNLETYLRLTLRALREGNPAVVFWPESSMAFFVEEEPLYRASIASVLGREGAELVAGAPRRIGEDDPLYTNSIWQIDPRGRIVGRYDKEVLVPFSEYFPLSGIDLLRRSFGRVRQFEPGDTPAPLPTAAGAGGVVVCNEAMLPEVVSARVAAGAEYLINPTNDTWIPHPQYTLQQFRIAATRAIEQRRTLVRISTGGPSEIVDPWGRVVEQLDAGERGVVLGEVRRRSEPSVYHRVGDLFAAACAAAAGLAFLWRARGWRQGWNRSVVG